MLEKLIQFLNLSEEQKKQFNDLKSSYETEDKELNQKIKDLFKEKKETWNSKMKEFEGILSDEQKDRMKSLFGLFQGFGSKKTSC